MLLGDLIRLAGYERFVDQNLPLFHHGVRRNLIARPEDDDIVQHQFFRGNGLLLTIPDHGRPGRV